MLSVAALPILLLLTLACLLTLAIALWAVTAGRHDEDSAQTVPAAKARIRAFAFYGHDGFSRGRAPARPTPSWVRPDGRGAQSAPRRRPRRGRSG